MWGELASHKRLFNPPPQFSRLGILVSLRPISLSIFNFLCGMCVFVCQAWDHPSSFLVCYAHTLYMSVAISRCKYSFAVHGLRGSLCYISLCTGAVTDGAYPDLENC